MQDYEGSTFPLSPNNFPFCWDFKKGQNQGKKALSLHDFLKSNTDKHGGGETSLIYESGRFQAAPLHQLQKTLGLRHVQELK